MATASTWRKQPRAAEIGTALPFVLIFLPMIVGWIMSNRAKNREANQDVLRD